MRWAGLGQAVPAKLGQNLQHFVAITESALEGKYGNVGFDYREEGTIQRPGPYLTINVDYRRVDYNGQALNVLCDKIPPTINDPYLIIVDSVINPRTEAIVGLASTLNGLADDYDAI